MSASSKRTQYWLFQYTQPSPEWAQDHDAVGVLAPWKLTQHAFRVAVNDVAFCWRAGREAGLTSWGTIEDVALEKSGAQAKVRTAVSFASLIPRDEARKVPELADLGVVARGHTGTVFPVSTEQAAGLADLIERFGYQPPVVEESEVKRILRRRLDRDLGRLEEVALGSPLDASSLSLHAQGAREVIDAEDFDAAKLGIHLSNLKLYADRLSAPTGGDTTPSREALRIHEAVQQVLTNQPALDRIARTFNAEPGEFQVKGTSIETSVNVPVKGVAAGSGTGAATAIAAQPPQAIARGAPPHWKRWFDGDYVGIRAEVDNLTKYITHNSLVPPKAIGIFGEWGSGKSFFMTALKRQVELIAWQSRAGQDEGLSPSYNTRVIQIDFNAWHYVESNLWASLAGHTFEHLHKGLQRLAAGTDAEPDPIFTALATYKEARAEFERRSETVKDLQDARTSALERLNTASNSAAKLLRTFADQTRAQLRTALGGIADEERKRLGKAIGSGELDALAASADQIQTLAKGGSSLARQVWTEVQTWSAAGFVGAAAVAVAVGVAVPLLAGFFQATIAKVAVIVVPYLGVAGVALRWIAANGQRVLQAARTANAKIVEAREAADAEKQARTVEIDSEIAEAREGLKAAEAQLERERAALEKVRMDGNPGEQLKSYIALRARDDSYKQHLTLVSTVRRDFEQLSELMAKGRTAAAAPQGQVVLGEGDDLKKAPLVDRIILYVDDLDRCPPDKVVEVLQAVHLMLNFELFIVVVAVDVRWVGRSLVSHYKELLVEEHRATASAGGWDSASSDDYLEKIFQIPFRILPLADRERSGLVKAISMQSMFGAASQSTDPIPEFDLTPKDLELYPPEKACIEELHQCLGRSPRRVIRFMDVYKLMRAGMAQAEVDLLQEDERYRVLLALFALLTGSPRIGPEVVRRIYTSTAPTAYTDPSFLASLESDRGKGHGEEEVINARRVLEFLAIGDVQKTQRSLIEYIPRVAQYSVRSLDIDS